LERGRLDLRRDFVVEVLAGEHRRLALEQVHIFIGPEGGVRRLTVPSILKARLQIVRIRRASVRLGADHAEASLGHPRHRARGQHPRHGARGPVVVSGLPRSASGPALMRVIPSRTAIQNVALPRLPAPSGPIQAESWRRRRPGAALRRQPRSADPVQRARIETSKTVGRRFTETASEVKRGQAWWYK
jgi:hypothetical protein